MIRSVGLRATLVGAFVVVVAGAGSAYEVQPADVVESPAPLNNAVTSPDVLAVTAGLDPTLKRAFDIRYGLMYVTPPVFGPFFPQWALLETPQQLAGAVQPIKFPPVPADTGSGRRIVYDKSDQRIWIISETERVLDSYLVSGKLSEPRPGTYRVYSKSPNAVAFYQGITMKWMVRFAYGSVNGISIGFHDLPLYADGTPMMTHEQFGTPLSGGCVRQPDHKARSLYAWADIGTTVVVQP
ncbi:MAG: L,D-transpeptidase [Acidimicrobiia bacterium]